MKAQARQEQTRASVYEALSHQAVRHGIVFHNDHLVYRDRAGAPIEICYRDIFRIITTSLYIGIMQNHGFLHIFLCNSDRTVFIDLHVGDALEFRREQITPEQNSENISRELEKIIGRHTNGAE